MTRLKNLFPGFKNKPGEDGIIIKKKPAAFLICERAANSVATFQMAGCLMCKCTTWRAYTCICRALLNLVWVDSGRGPCRFTGLLNGVSVLQQRRRLRPGCLSQNFLARFNFFLNAALITEMFDARFYFVCFLFPHQQMDFHSRLKLDY